MRGKFVALFFHRNDMLIQKLSVLACMGMALCALAAPAGAANGDREQIILAMREQLKDPANAKLKDIVLLLDENGKKTVCAQSASNIPRQGPSGTPVAGSSQDRSDNGRGYHVLGPRDAEGNVCLGGQLAVAKASK